MFVTFLIIYVFPLLFNAFFVSECGISIYTKMNPIWWLLNDDDPIDQPKYDNRYPGKPHWYRVMRHAWRNPAANACRYIFGFKDKKWIIRGSDMWPESGPVCITLPWFAFRIGRFNGYMGWNVGPDRDAMNFGALTFALRRQ